MSTFLQMLLRSLETGAIYALASLGIIIVYRTNFMVNFAQGTMGMFGAYIVLQRTELANVTRVIEGIRYQVPAERIKSMLIY